MTFTPPKSINLAIVLILFLYSFYPAIIHAAEDKSRYALVEAFPKLPAIKQMVGLFQAPNEDSRWYVVSQSGLVQWFDNQAGAKKLHPFIDLSSRVRNAGEMGLLGMAFDPQYLSNSSSKKGGAVYFSYVDKQRRSIISRINHQGNEPLSLKNEVVLLTLPQPAGNHNGGHIAFGPDGYLYIGFGDGGGSNDTYQHGQNSQSLFGTLMRVAVNANSNSYKIPDDNPFVANTKVRNEIYAYGLRNPWRWSFDRKTDELWLGDVGQNLVEEIDIVRAGDNLGWPIMEGSDCFKSASCDSKGLTLPVAEYRQGDGECSVTGGYVYRGKQVPGLTGHFIYGDFCSGRVYSTVKSTVNPASNKQYASQSLLVSGMNIAAFAQDLAGEVYVLAYVRKASSKGRIYRLALAR